MVIALRKVVIVRVAALLTVPVLLLVGCGSAAAPPALPPQNGHATAVPTLSSMPATPGAPVAAHAAERAVATCTTPVKDKLRTQRDLRDVVVAAVPPDQLRVSGSVTDEAGVAHQWQCVVSPDATDPFRDLKVDRLITSS